MTEAVDPYKSNELRPKCDNLFVRSTRVVSVVSGVVVSGMIWWPVTEP